MGTDTDVEPGMLLVAAPQLLDQNFRRTVVYIIHHRAEGTLGVVLNRPSEVSVDDVLPRWGPHASEPQSLFVGGPVEQRTAICLAALRTGVDVASVSGMIGVRGPIGLVDLDGDPADLVPRARGLRFFAGYAGWDADQLAGEIDRGDWLVVPALPDDVIAAPGPELWGRVLRRQGPPLAFLATHPGDVKVN
ncbi:YqgE/AlgH family protein [Saccharopolyspora erythraea]|uniref:YqgE/AlgH family protein n=1 Tax=Saccharopolyspora erythraea TaxID=1836 RepID=UPI001BAAF2C5|nr:YqgE/AlgH family protein [Saccharopolyspora erythraea]QUH05655.1 YqgE/AlgH family protein [Saccharopolyspora erythraea]